ncbi:hypothetical protein FRC18_006096 [Serendipita sp. 400]|nr:hypothetical protein FRC18_006096 [Serendipita sp. 400]
MNRPTGPRTTKNSLHTKYQYGPDPTPSLGSRRYQHGENLCTIPEEPLAGLGEPSTPAHVTTGRPRPSATPRQQSATGNALGLITTPNSASRRTAEPNATISQPPPPTSAPPPPTGNASEDSTLTSNPRTATLSQQFQASTNAAAGALNVCLQPLFQLPPQTPNNQRATMNSYTFSEGDDDSDFSDDGLYVSANEINALRAKQEAANPRIIPEAPPAPAPAPAFPGPPAGIAPDQWQFIVQGMVLAANAIGQEQVQRPAPKINYAVQFLTGSAEQWFHPYLDISADDPKAPRLLFDWNAFTLALETNFGLADPVADTESAIETVVMRDDDRIATYNVSFNKYATLLEWNDPPLRRAYWRSPSGKLFSAT